MPKPLTLQGMLCFSIYRASHTFNHLYRPLLDSVGLTYPQYLVLVGLWSHDDRTVKELGAALSLESNTLTPLLKRLESMGYIARSRDPHDERSVRIKLTSEGKKLEKKAEHIPVCIAESVGLSNQDVQAMLHHMHMLHDRLQKAVEAAT